MKWFAIMPGICLALALMLLIGCGGESAYLTVDLGKGVTMQLAPVPAGKFMMGSPADETSRNDNEGPQRQVTIAEPFHMGICEVTRAQWRAVMGTEPWAGKASVKSGADHAANHISWKDANRFCEALSKKIGRKVALPTEAQWEYACRAGSRTPYCFGDDESKLGDYAWYEANAWDRDEKYAHAVGRKRPNAWGLHDMHGNVWEWCGDWFVDYARKDKPEVVRITQENYSPELVLRTMRPDCRTLRGGAFDDSVSYCRSAVRAECDPAFGSRVIGFRVVIARGSAAKRRSEPGCHTRTDTVLDLGNGVTMKLALVPAGKFVRYVAEEETDGDGDEIAGREIIISTPFYMGIYEVTQDQWRSVMGSEPWRRYATGKCGGEYPAVGISWDDARRFCRKLSKKTGRQVTLPSEAQWEYACGAGSKGAFCHGDDKSKLGDYGWYIGNSLLEDEEYAHPVGGKKPNAWGLYDMHGNVREWCRDWYDEEFYERANIVDPENTTESTDRVRRGGAFDCDAGYLMTTDRGPEPPDDGDYGDSGFRVIVTHGSGGD